MGGKENERGCSCNLNLMIKNTSELGNGLVIGAGKWQAASIRKHSGHGEGSESLAVAHLGLIEPSPDAR